MGIIDGEFQVWGTRKHCFEAYLFYLQFVNHQISPKAYENLKRILLGK